MEVKAKRKYDDEYHAMSTKRVAKCGHVTKIGRYFKCEKCQPDLESDDGDLTYFQFTDGRDGEDEE